MGTNYRKYVRYRHEKEENRNHLPSYHPYVAVFIIFKSVFLVLLCIYYAHISKIGNKFILCTFY